MSASTLVKQVEDDIHEENDLGEAQNTHDNVLIMCSQIISGEYYHRYKSGCGSNNRNHAEQAGNDFVAVSKRTEANDMSVTPGFGEA